MTKNFMIIVVNLRKKEAVTVQKILTEWGCFIKTRLGLHEGVLDQCSEVGSIILELVGEKEKHQELTRKLNLLAGVNAQYFEIPVKM
ncbi:MAG: hypothetical protein M0R34_06775 [Candidatus Marinimicrobia bacterium]|jgi:hypothetical protein|nr:hypothetical protein [Candidatus Neomarinimicrobiota bacterium]MCK9484050.1 hypothetical protein [Candidatus Neomarinimicrobiota bacterium]MCK9560158.1 hypothetical protein [Candidatus Neomarinimicrobiota bacterium]MDD5062914.1 hypothetical protein [Candidatus Neomarinimicrobiota bacterium]MDD5540857.1 hypothetical protein [Candidatus Neomarinimicrobiota bacterium]